MKYVFLLPLLAMLAITTLPVFASTGMSNCTEEPESDDCNPQPDRVGNDHDENNEVTRDGPDEKEDANCWGKVTSDFTTTQDGDGGGGRAFGGHTSDPVGGDDDNETPREGVGNQDEDHPSDHADTVGPRFGSDEECTE
jgi:hypothetical protein